YDPSRVGGVAYVSNQSLNGVITRLTHPGGNKPVWAVLAVSVLALCLWAATRLWSDGLVLPAIATLALPILLVSPVSWSHHWVWAIVIVAALADERFGPWWARWTLLVGTVALFTSNIIWTVPNTNDREYAHHGWQLVRANAYAEAAIV